MKLSLFDPKVRKVHFLRNGGPRRPRPPCAHTDRQTHRQTEDRILRRTPPHALCEARGQAAPPHSNMRLARQQYSCTIKTQNMGMRMVQQNASGLQQSKANAMGENAGVMFFSPTTLWGGRQRFRGQPLCHQK